MNQRELGKSGLIVSAIGLGCMGMSQSYGPGDETESVRTLNRALDIGVTFFDTAAVYGLGANERLLSRVLATRRAEVVLATKCGIVRGADGKPSALDGSPAEITRSCDQSLERLGIDVIDLFYLHRVDPKVPIEESVGAMARLVRAGKVRYLGLSEAGPSTLRRAHDVHPITALQSEYSLWWREPEASVLPACRALGIGFVPFSPLGRGFLSGTVTGTDTLSNDDMRRTLPRFQGENPRSQSRPRGESPAAGRCKTVHAFAVGVGVAARSGPGHCADPRHEAANLPRKQRRRRQHSAERQRPENSRQCVSAGCRRGRSLSVRNDGLGAIVVLRPGP